MKIGAFGTNYRITFDFDTYLAAEKIDSIHVLGYRLWVVAGNMINEFAMGGAQLANKQSRIKSPPSTKTQDVHSHVFDA